MSNEYQVSVRTPYQGCFFYIRAAGVLPSRYSRTAGAEFDKPSKFYFSCRISSSTGGFTILKRASLTIGVQWHTILLDRWCPMEYKRIVQTVVETPTYLAVANKLFSEEERADIVALVAADPECGDVIRGTGGFRKVRVARQGMGKSGGARGVDIQRNEKFPVFLITVFPKNEKENLSTAERNALKRRADSIFESYRG